ncbi:hypothetical protein [Nonomuraea sp. NPDC023979]|uniref:hypothetical protein n=1 Tax=Nonomuraea sp. NPDC023979 TaxID=3154796 RepID=UPI0033E1B23A
MNTYDVEWGITEDADSPAQAAERAWQHMRKPGSTANIFTVTDKATGERSTVDLHHNTIEPATPSRLGIHLSRERPEEHLGPLDDDTVKKIAACVWHSSIPQALQSIREQLLPEEDDE